MSVSQKFKELMREIFDLNYPELDHGIYKLLNLKRQTIEDFIDNKIEHILQQELMSIQETEHENIKLAVYNHLLEFFSRYFYEGDFIPVRRIKGRKYCYAIPYDGREIMLQWATRDMYYVKSFPIARVRRFDIEGVSFVFQLVNSQENIEVIQQITKHAKLKNVHLVEDTPITVEGNTCTINFCFKVETSTNLPNNNNNDNENNDQQEEQTTKKDHLQLLHDKIVNCLSNNAKLLTLLLKKEGETTVLMKQLRAFTKTLNSDFFIHKNLKDFLEEQLDYYIKSWVVEDIDHLEDKSRITVCKILKSVGCKIIDFLHQIEEFQRILWERKKFVLTTEYVITVDRIPDLWYEVLKSKQQIKEWEQLGFGTIRTKEDLQGKKLPVDTKNYNAEFKQKLLMYLSSKGKIDDMLDGVLIKSENWQALNLILNRYKGKVQTIYIDPPFNKEQDADYLYNVKYKDSTWTTMLENRLKLAKELLKDTGSIFVRCDYNGNWIVRPLMDEIFGKENFRNEIGVRRFRKNVMEKEIKKLPEGLDTIFIYSSSEKFKYVYPYKTKQQKREGFWRHMGDSSGQGTPKIFFGKEISPPEGKHWKYSQEKINQMIEAGTLILVCGNCGYQHNNTKGDWKGCPICKKDLPIPKYWVEAQEEEVLDSDWTDLCGYSTGWNFPTENSEFLLKRVIESTSNEGDLVMDFFLGSGTTTAVAHKLKRKWIGVEMGEHFWTHVLPRMKKVLAYDKSAISKEKDVKEKYNEETAGGFFKYLILEQYEDALQNVKFDESKTQGINNVLFSNDDKQMTEFTTKYMFAVEARNSITYPNMKVITDPFNIEIDVVSLGNGVQKVKVDLVETFNYILGVEVHGYYFGKNGKMDYVFVYGRKLEDDKQVLIVWRNLPETLTKEIMENDKNYISQFVAKLNKIGVNVEQIYANYDAVVHNYINIDTELARLIIPHFSRTTDIDPYYSS